MRITGEWFLFHTYRYGINRTKIVGVQNFYPYRRNITNAGSLKTGLLKKKRKTEHQKRVLQVTDNALMQTKCVFFTTQDTLHF